MPEDYNMPWVLEFLEDLTAQRIEDIRHPEGHLLGEVVITGSNRPEDRMRANLQASIERRLLKDAKDNYTLLRNMNQALTNFAQKVGLPLMFMPAAPLATLGWSFGSPAFHGAALAIDKKVGGHTADNIVSGAELGLMALGAGAGAYAGGRALLNNTNLGRAWLLSRAIGRGKVRETPTFRNNISYYTPNSPSLQKYVYHWQQPSRSTLTEAERLGIPKGERNNIKSINPDNVYGNLKFIRNIDGLPIVEDGLAQLGNSNKLLTNFTTDLPFRLHSWYPNIPGPTYMIISPRAFKGKKFFSINPGDSFLSTIDSKVTPNQIRIISGDPKILEEAERRGMRTLTSDKLQDLFNVGSEITKKEFELGRNGAVRPFANADAAINDFKFRQHFYGEDAPEILSKYLEGVVTPYRAEIDRLITQNIGRPSTKDYLVLENMTGLDAGITSKFDPKFIENAKDPLANKDMFEKVYYSVTPKIEEELMNSIGLYSGPYYSFFNLLKLSRLNGNPLKHKQGGKMNIIEKFKEGRKIHIKKANRGKFTEYCGGKVTSECIARGKNSSDPAVRKRATFAANARKWKHKKGGKAFVEGVSALDSNPKAYKRVKKMYKMRGYAGGGNFDLGSAILGGVQLIGTSIGTGLLAKREKEWNESIEAQQKAMKANALRSISEEEIGSYAKDLSDRLTLLIGERVNVSPIDIKQILLKKRSDILSDVENYSQQWAAQKKLLLGLNNPSSRWTDLLSSVGDIATGLISQSTNKNNAPSTTLTNSFLIQAPRLYNINKNYMNSDEFKSHFDIV